MYVNLLYTSQDIEQLIVGCNYCHSSFWRFLVNRSDEIMLRRDYWLFICLNLQFLFLFPSALKSNREGKSTERTSDLAFDDVAILLSTSSKRFVMPVLKWTITQLRASYHWRASLVAWRVKHPPTMRETQVQSLSREDPLEKEMATHSSTLAWKIPWTEEPGRLQSMGSQRVRHDWVTSLSLSLKEITMINNIIANIFKVRSVSQAQFLVLHPCYYMSNLHKNPIK